MPLRKLPTSLVVAAALPVPRALNTMWPLAPLPTAATTWLPSQNKGQRHSIGEASHVLTTSCIGTWERKALPHLTFTVGDRFSLLPRLRMETLQMWVDKGMVDVHSKKILQDYDETPRDRDTITSYQIGLHFIIYLLMMCLTQC